MAVLSPKSFDKTIIVKGQKHRYLSGDVLFAEALGDDGSALKMIINQVDRFEWDNNLDYQSLSKDVGQKIIKEAGTSDPKKLIEYMRKRKGLL